MFKAQPPFYYRFLTVHKIKKMYKMGYPYVCYNDFDNCKAKILPLKILSSHFPFLRTLLRRFYELHSLILSIHDIEKSLQDADVNCLKDIIKQANPQKCSFPASTNSDISDEKYLNE